MRITLLAVLSLAIVASVTGTELTYTPVSLQIADSVEEMGLVSANAIPDWQETQQMTKQFVRENLCYPNTPVGRQEDKLTHGNEHYDVVTSDKQTVSRQIHHGWRSVRWSVRRADFYVSGPRITVCNSVWAGAGTAFLFDRSVKVGTNSKIDTLLTAHHITNFGEYQEELINVGNILIDGQYTAQILPAPPNDKFGVVTTPQISEAMPIDWLQHDEQIVADNWKVGETVIIPYYTLAVSCPPVTRMDQYRCMTETAHAQRGRINSSWPVKGKSGADIFYQADTMGGASGAPVLKYEGGNSPQDLELIGINNIGWPSGQGGAQRITQTDARQIRNAVDNLQNIYEN